jgi:hypothetical protein
MLHAKFRFIWPSSFRGEDLFKSANQKQELPVAAMFVNTASFFGVIFHTTRGKQLYLFVNLNTHKVIQLHFLLFFIHPGDYNTISLSFSIHTGEYSSIFSSLC